MKTWVLWASRRNAVEWIIRSQSRRKSLRVALAGSSWRRPRLAAGSAAKGARVRAAFIATFLPCCPRRPGRPLTNPGLHITIEYQKQATERDGKLGGID